MITKPSLGELLDAATGTAEQVVPALAGTSGVESITSVLAVLDRIKVEWTLAACHLVEDNLDIQLTLQRIGRASLAGEQPSPPTVDDLNARNVALKAALVRAMEELDLPAPADAAPERLAADHEVRELLARMLRREALAMPPVESRVSALSRGGAALDEAQVEQMTSALRGFLTEQMPDATGIAVHDFTPLAGGASREAFLFEVDWQRGGEDHHERCVLLRQPVSSVLESDETDEKITGSRRLPHVEFKMIQRMEAQGVPVPHMLWVDPEGRWLERPFSVARFIAGESDLSKLGDEPHLPTILDQYVDILAQVHNVDLAAAGVDFLGNPSVESAASEQVELFADGFERQRLEEHPGITYLVRWLRQNCPVAPRVSVVHGDFRLGNFMWDDEGIVAMLDWEQCHLGDPLEEIAFMYWPLWSLGAMIPIRDFVARYEQASGIAVDDRALAFYRAFIELKMCVVLLTGIRSFYATPGRQLLYGASAGFEMLRNCQLRFFDDLAAGGPTVEFGDALR